MSERTWTEVGEEFLRKAFEEGKRWHREYDEGRERARIVEQIDQLKWRKPEGNFPMSPGLLLMEVIEQMPIRDVSAVAINGYLPLPDGPETASYSIHGIEATFNGGRVRIYLLDIGTGAVPLVIDENVPEPALGV